MTYKMLAYFAVFMSIAFVLYQIFPKKFKYLILLFFSYLFYFFSNGYLSIFLISLAKSIPEPSKTSMSKRNKSNLFSFNNFLALAKDSLL